MYYTHMQYMNTFFNSSVCMLIKAGNIFYVPTTLSQRHFKYLVGMISFVCVCVCVIILYACNVLTWSGILSCPMQYIYIYVY